MAAPQHDEFLMKHYYGHFIITISKANDDLFNRLNAQIKTQTKVEKKLIESNKDKQLEEPFYERLRREDKFREEEIRKYEQERRMRLSFAASHTPSG